IPQEEHFGECPRIAGLERERGVAPGRAEPFPDGERATREPLAPGGPSARGEGGSAMRAPLTAGDSGRGRAVRAPLTAGDSGRGPRERVAGAALRQLGRAGEGGRGRRCGRFVPGLDRERGEGGRRWLRARGWRGAVGGPRSEAWLVLAVEGGRWSARDAVGRL